MRSSAAIAALMLLAATASAEPVEVPLVNPSFEGAIAEDGAPEGWSRYGGHDRLSVSVVDDVIAGGQALLIEDDNPEAEVGVHQTFALEGGQNVRVRVSVRRATEESTAGAYLQLRFLPSNEFEQIGLRAESADRFSDVVLFTAVPEDTERARLYLYTHAAPTPKLVVDRVTVEAGLDDLKFPEIAAPDPTPPQYDALKDLHLQTALVEGGEARAAIVTGSEGRYAEEAQAIQQAIAEITGVELPIVADTDSVPPFDQNVILLGARETSAAVRRMYEHFFTLLDARFPGPGGHVVRTSHNPYADGLNAILVGAGEDTGVTTAAEALIEHLREADGGEGALEVGYLRDIALSEQYEIPRDPTEMEIWEASRTYGSSGYFGWNIISKHMAAFFATGDEYHAQEFLRLSFPDEQAIAQIEEADGERIENKHDPLAGPYHYSAHMMILFWDLIEEDPFFTDEQRLEVTNAFSRQLTHRVKERIYGRTEPPAHVGGRHADWSAMSLYTLARYFDRDYPCPIWHAALTSADIHFDGIKNSAWMAGNNDHLFWYMSFYDPLVNYMHLSGDLGGMENLEQALKTQDILFTGETNDWGVRASSLNFLHRAADLTGDGRFVFYRDRTGLDLEIFRLGQSWWPEIEAREPTELLETWTLQPMPEPMWRARRSGLPADQQFLWGTWRTALDGTGDLMMIKGHNGGGRLPYHTFSVMEQRLADHTLLKGYRTQVLTSADGMVEPEVAMDAALLDHGALGDTAWAVGEVPKTPFANWRRAVVQREGSYALFVDDLTFRTDSDNVKVETEWNTVGGRWDAERNAMLIAGSTDRPEEDALSFAALETEIRCGPGTAEDLLSNLTSIDTVLLKAPEPGTWMEMPFTLDEPVTGQLFADVLDHTDRGIISLALNGEVLVEAYDHHAEATIRSQVDLGEHSLAAGEHVLRVEVVGGHEEVERMYVGLIGLTIRPEGAEAAPEPLSFELHPSHVMDASGSGMVVMSWLGAATEGQQRRFFHLLAPARDGERIECHAIDEGVAALSLPEPALAVSGQSEIIAADAALLADSHLFGWRLTESPMLSSDAPVTVAWDFAGSVLRVAAEQPTTLTLRHAPGDEQTMQIEAGETTIDDVTVDAEQLADFRAHVRELLTEARAQRERELAAAAQPEPIDAAEMAPVASTEIDGRPVAAEVIRRDESDIVALAEDTTVHLLSAEGEVAHTLDTDGPIRVLRWWEEADLLLVGCEDEQVIAFDIDSGERRWVFVSEMDRAVWEEGKQYWFKSAHPGIYGLHTGDFGAVGNVAFVGSACTLEILGQEGELLHRMPIFWGPGWKFELLDRDDGSRDLLVARWPNGNDTVAMVNSGTLEERGKSFSGVPSGHTMVGGWTAQNRTAIQLVDASGDGQPQLVSVTNGRWNRVTVFSRDGSPQFNAQFGPGPSNRPYETMRDMGVADLDGDGTMEIVVAIADGLVVTLDHECNRVWATRLPSPPTTVQIVTPGGGAPVIVAGCEDGTIARLNASGEIEAIGHAGSRVEALVTVGAADGPFVVAANADGRVTLW